MDEAKKEERCCCRVLAKVQSAEETVLAYRRRYNALNENQRPRHNQGLDRIREGMCLVYPGDVGRCDEEHRDAPMPGRLDELMNRPVLQHEAYDEHKHPQGPEDGDRWYVSVIAVSYPEPAEQQHRQTIDGP